MIFLFIALAILTTLSILFFLLFPLIKRNSLRKNFINSYGRVVYGLANEKDFYLINRLLLKSNDGNNIDIDHLLLTNKYIFVIKDFYFEGALLGKDSDNTWVYYFGSVKEPSKKLVPNPLFENDRRLNKLSLITGLDKSFLISLILVNDDCDLSLLKKDDPNTYVVRLKELKPLIEKIESSNVAPLNDDQLKWAVQDIAKLNLRKKKNG